MTNDDRCDDVLIVEDDEATAELERRVLTRAGSRSVVVSRIKDALELLDSRRFSAVILDYHLPDGEAWAVVEAADSKRPRIPVILVTGQGNERVASQAIQRGVTDYVKKTGSFWDLLPDIVNRVTHLASAEQRLQASDAKFRTMVESIKDYAIFMLDTGGRVVSWNAGAARIAGYREEEIIGRHFSCFYPDGAVLDGKPARDLMIAGTQDRSEDEGSRVRKDGTLFVANVIITALRDEAGELQGFIQIVRDVTALRDTESQVRKGNERLQIAVDAAGIGVWEFDVLSQRLTWNDWMYRIYGLAPSASDEPYSLWMSSVHPDDRQRCQWHIDAALRGEMEFDTEFRLLRADGDIRHVKAASRTSRGVDGRAINMVGVNFDVTDRRRNEEQLHKTSSMLRTVLDSASDVSIIATDPNLNISMFNLGAERLLGYTSKEIAGSTLLLIHDEKEIRARSVELSAQLKRPVDGGAVLIDPSMLRRALEWTYVCKDGNHVTVSLVVTPMHTYEGELLGYVGVAQDVTQQKRYEESLRVATQHAERANNAKSLFLANMSHEIRTPMNAVTGLAYLLEQTSLSPEQKGFVSQINIASKSLLAVISDVLDLSKIEAGELMISNVPFSPRVLLKGLHAVNCVQADLKGIALRIDMPDDLPAALQGDGARLNQILTNLLSNAIKFTERGGVTLCVRLLGSTATGSRLSFTVCDTGIGIDPAAQARLFTPFVQGDESITRRFGGTGLGLSIIHSLAKLMGGTVDFTSAVGVGSEFRVVLEFARANAESLAITQPVPASPGERPLSGVRVFVVDDYDLNLVVTRRILEQAGARVWVANNGQVAVEQLQRLPDHFDVVLMDVQMPIMDGYEATRRIRDDLGLRELPIIALTAGALASERQRATAAGMNEFIIKPFDASTVVSSVMRHAVGARLPPAAIDSATPSAREPVAWPEIDGIDMEAARKRLCDDPALFRSLLQRLLGDFADMTIRSSQCGPAGLIEQASRLHKLKGGAGILGATVIQRLAAEAEAACVEGDAAQAAERSTELVTHLDALRSSAARAIEGARLGHGASH